MDIKLSKAFAPNSAADAFDVRQVKGALNRLGYYVPYEKTGITGIPDSAVFGALKSFQKDHGLHPDGIAKPGDETIKALNREATKAPDGYYIWRSCEDDKVRPAHAAHDWETRAWSDSPDPCEDINCRCWADAATPEQVEKKNKQRCFDKLSWEDEAKANIKGHERDIPFPYVDTAFKITIGFGINIDQKKLFIALPWKIGSITGSDATKKQIEDGYASLHENAATHAGKNGKFNVTANNQEGLSHLYLAEDARDKLFESAFTEFSNGLSEKFSDFNCFPPPAKVALMDMIYNLGETKFSRMNWPNLFKSISQRDWNIAAEQCHRQDIPETRNTNTSDQFKEASTME